MLPSDFNTTLVSIISLFLIIYFYYKYKHNYWRRKNVPQLQPTIPFGNITDFVLCKTSVLSVFKKIYDQTKQNGFEYSGIYLYARKALFVRSPTLVKQILTSDFQHFHDRDIYYDEINDPLTANLIALEGLKWKRLRAKITPTFTSGKLKTMFHTVSNCAIELKTICHENRTIEIKDVLARFTTDVIGSCAFGIECNSLKNPKTKFREYGVKIATQTFTDIFKLVIYKNFPKLARFLKMKVFNPDISNFFIDVVRQTVEHREKNHIVRNDFMQLLIQLKNNETVDEVTNTSDFKLNMNEIAAQAFIFFVAGFETSSTVTSFALYEIALNRNIQTKLRQEVMEITAKYNGEVTYDGIMEMEYMEEVIFETMRKYPAVPLILRKCTKNYKLPNCDAIVEEGTPVFISTWGMHSDPEYFPEPEKFLPERFNKENKSKHTEFTYLPFGDGPRVCIGLRFSLMQIKIAIAHLLSNFEFTLNEKTSVPLKFDKTRQAVLHPLGGVWLNVTKLN